MSSSCSSRGARKAESAAHNAVPPTSAMAAETSERYRLNPMEDSKSGRESASAQ